MQVLKPAIELAEGGFPVHPVAAHLWGAEVASLQKQGRKLTAMLQPNGSAPKAGQIQRNPDLASTFRTIAEKGVKDGAALFSSAIPPPLPTTLQNAECFGMLYLRGSTAEDSNDLWMDFWV